MNDRDESKFVTDKENMSEDSESDSNEGLCNNMNNIYQIKKI